jgi:hypothetical protein
MPTTIHEPAVIALDPEGHGLVVQLCVVLCSLWKSCKNIWYTEFRELMRELTKPQSIRNLCGGRLLFGGLVKGQKLLLRLVCPLRNLVYKMYPKKIMRHSDTFG